MGKRKGRSKNRNRQHNNHNKNQNNKFKNNNQSAYRNQNAKRPKRIKLTVVQITELLYGSDYIDWDTYTHDEICSDIGKQNDGRVAGKTV